MTTTGRKQALFERVGDLRAAIRDVRDGQRDAWDTINELTDFLQAVPHLIKSLCDEIAPSKTAQSERSRTVLMALREHKFNISVREAIYDARGEWYHAQMRESRGEPRAETFRALTRIDEFLDELPDIVERGLEKPFGDRVRQSPGCEEPMGLTHLDDAGQELELER